MEKLIFSLLPKVFGALKTGIKSTASIIKNRDKNKAAWEKEMAKATRGSWKDEFWTIVLGMPIILQQLAILLGVYLDDHRLMDAADQMIDNQQVLFAGQYAFVVITAVTASFGIKMRDSAIKKSAVNAIASVEKKKAAHGVNHNK